MQVIQKSAGGNAQTGPRSAVALGKQTSRWSRAPPVATTSWFIRFVWWAVQRRSGPERPPSVFFLWKIGIGRGSCIGVYIPGTWSLFLVVVLLSNPHPRTTLTFSAMSQQLLKENVLKFIESRILSSEKEDQAVYFLSQEVALILPKVLGKMSKEVQQKFIDLLDKVCPNLPLFWDLWSITSAKECPALSLQSMEHIKKLGRVCSEIGLLPTSIVASGRIITDEMSITSGGATDFWKGKLDGKLVAIKAFRAFSKLSPDRLEAAKKVSKHSGCEALSEIDFPDYLGIGSCVEETSAPQRLTVLWR